MLACGTDQMLSGVCAQQDSFQKEGGEEATQVLQIKGLDARLSVV